MKNRILVLLMLSGILWACKNKKTSLRDDDKIDVSEFIDFFPQAGLPFRVADTSLLKKQTDSSLIGYKIFTQFIPDSLLKKDFGKNARPRLYPLGRVRGEGKVTYLFVKAVYGRRGVGYLVCFDRQEHYLNTMPVVRTGFDRNTHAYGMLDRHFTITTYREHPVSNVREPGYKRNVYVYDHDANDFTLIMSDPNEDIIRDVINPIDTLPAKHKYSGDYVINKRNFISIRDTEKPSVYWFFIHFEKNGGTCTGELKGRARMISATAARYQENGNPCALQFSFSSRSVSMKEVGGCGTYRDIRCFFEGRFPRKSVPASKRSRKK